ncbi:hypothetical protein GGX14DRAFT_398895 [Mycena pura]|uniref:Uncharacterized protein n=1 Tax=Mycena pura TaxID=153505 RepID=A0AAD6V5A1_9AGAR|nr:hypothetical protein GGX14DRAFT_398895 [Mycena pura]
MRPGSHLAFTGALPVNTPRLRCISGGVKRPKRAPAAQLSEYARPSVPPTTCMPPDALSPALESHPHLNPPSVPLRPAYAEPEGRCATSLPVTTRQMDTRQTCMAVHTLDDPCAACELRYDLFATEILFNPAEADKTPSVAAVNALAKEYRGEVLVADYHLQSLLSGYMKGRSPHTGDNPQLDLNALACPPRRSARLLAARLAAEAKQCLSCKTQPSNSAKPHRTNASSASGPKSKPRRKDKASKPKALSNTRPWIPYAGQNILSNRHKHEFFAERSCGLYPNICKTPGVIVLRSKSSKFMERRRGV